MRNERFQKLVKQAGALYRESDENRITALRSSIVAGGSLYDFTALYGHTAVTEMPLPEDVLPLEFMAVMQHRQDKALWYAVPADTHMLVGSNDIEIPSSAACGSLVLRCGQGLWIHENDFPLGRPTGTVPEQYIDDVRDRLATIVAGTTIVSSHAKAVEQDPDYEAWISWIGFVSDKLEQMLHIEPQVVSIAADFTEAGIPGVTASESSYALAADSGPSQSAESPPSLPPRIWEHDLEDPAGTLRIYFYEDSNQLIISYRGESHPPTLRVAGSDVLPGQWDQAAEGLFHWSEPIAIENEPLELLFAGRRLELNP